MNHGSPFKKLATVGVFIVFTRPREAGTGASQNDQPPNK
jgi:hypothetical protein